MNLFRFDRFRRFIGIPEYLAGTKLERLNSKVKISIQEQPKVFSDKPAGSMKKKAKEGGKK
jgi:hypothetical protein